MGKLGDAFKDGRLVGGLVIAGVVGAFGVVGGTVVAIDSAAAPAAVVETVAPTLDPTAYTTNGLASEQETDAAAAEAARIEAERVAAEAAAAAEAARVAAEHAAAAEAERIAAEEAAAYEEPVYDEPAAPAPVESSGVPAGAWPLTWVADPNAADGGYWNFGACATSASTINGQPYCIP